MNRVISAMCLVAFLFAAQPRPTRADRAQAEASSQEQSRATKGPRCTFTRAEKFGMFLWLIPIAGAIYTPFACKRDVFGKGKRDQN
jgi:hypothetical protein